MTTFAILFLAKRPGWQAGIQHLLTLLYNIFLKWINFFYKHSVNLLAEFIHLSIGVIPVFRHNTNPGASW